MTNKLLLLIALLLLYSCRGSRDSAINYMREHREDLAELCAAYYPIKTNYVKGHTQIDTVVIKEPAEFVECDSVGQIIRLPEIRATTYIVKQVDTMYVESTAQLELKNNEIMTLKLNDKIKSKTIAELTAANEQRLKIIIVIGMVLLLLAGGILWKLKLF